MSHMKTSSSCLQDGGTRAGGLKKNHNQQSLARLNGHLLHSDPASFPVCSDGGATAISGIVLLTPVDDFSGGVVTDTWKLLEDLLGDFISFIASSHLVTSSNSSELSDYKQTDQRF